MGDYVLFKVSPWKGIIRLRKRGKLGPRYILPLKILARVRKVAYYLELHVELQQIHNTFHVCELMTFVADDIVVLPLKDIHVDERLSYVG